MNIPREILGGVNELILGDVAEGITRGFSKVKFSKEYIKKIIEPLEEFLKIP